MIYNGIYPESELEKIIPSLELLNQIMTIFGLNQWINKQKLMKPIQYLNKMNCFQLDKQHVLQEQLKSEYEIVRELAFNILLQFPQIISCQIEGDKLCSNVAQRFYEAGARILWITDFKTLQFEQKLDYLQNLIQKISIKFDKIEQNHKNIHPNDLFQGHLLLVNLVVKDLIKNVDDIQIYEKLFKEKIQMLLIILTKILKFMASIQEQDVNLSIFNLEVQSHDNSKQLQLQVAGFYNITKETALLLPNILQIIILQDQQNCILVDSDILKQLIDKYFDCMMKIQHLNTIELISEGIHSVCRFQYESKNLLLPQLNSEYIQEILIFIEKNNFKRVNRRSLGIPLTMSCLLNSEPPTQTKVLLPMVMQKLTGFIQNSQFSREMKIISLNIMRGLFLENGLKRDLESFQTDVIKMSLNGFSSTDWGVRNGSLMLFSCICKQIIGQSSKITVMQFFKRYPQLQNLFDEEIKRFILQEKYNLYPQIYPISLIFSCLQPQEDVQNFQSIQQNLEKALNHSNYLGRIMVANAIKSLISPQNIQSYLIQLLQEERISSVKSIKQNHNHAHGILTLIKLILKSYVVEFNHEKSFQLVSFLWEIQCPIILISIIKIASLAQVNKLTLKVLKYCSHNMGEFFQNKQHDFGERDLQLIKFKFFAKYHQLDDQGPKNLVQLFTKSAQIFQHNPQSFIQNYSQIFQQLAKQIMKIRDEQIIPSLEIFLNDKKAILNVRFVKCLKYLIRLKLLISCEFQQVCQISIEAIEQFPQNMTIIKTVLRVLSQMTSFLRQHKLYKKFLQLLLKYSSPENMDNIRLLSLHSLQEQFFEIDDHLIYQILITLIQDELSLIRTQTSSFIQTVILKNTNIQSNFQITLIDLFVQIGNQNNVDMTFLIEILFGTSNNKKINFEQKKIFRIQKANIFQDEIVNLQLKFEVLKELSFQIILKSPIKIFIKEYVQQQDFYRMYKLEYIENYTNLNIVDRDSVIKYIYQQII